LKSLYKECQPFIWSIDSTTKETEKKIKNESKIVTVVHFLHSFVSSIILLPSENEKDYHFTIYLFSTIFQKLHHCFRNIFFRNFSGSMLYICIPITRNTICYFSHKISNVYAPGLYQLFDRGVRRRRRRQFVEIGRVPESH
jgi:hypothetical protein